MLRIFFPIAILSSLLTSCGMRPNATVSGFPEKLGILRIDTFPVPASVRALEVVDDQTIWFAGSGGVYGFTRDGGRSWVIDSLQMDGIKPHFRGIAVTRKAVFLLSISSPALLYRSADWGKSWQLVFRDDHPDAFYDAIAFRDEQYGVAMGDPIGGCLSIIRTMDGGLNWEKVPCDPLPPTEAGEAAFAASNSNIALYQDHIWIATGGKRARIFHSADRGDHWEVFDTPVLQGGQMTGMYSIDFIEGKTGIAVGGDWNDKARNTHNKAITTDGGRTWQILAEGAHPGYRECVRFMPGTNATGILACGDTGISLSTDGGHHWRELSHEGFYTCRFGKDWTTVWLAGNGRIGKMVWTW